MKILSIYPNADGYGRIPTGLAIIMTVLERAGHEMELFDTTFLHEANRDNDTRERAGLVKRVEAYVGPERTSCDGMPVLAYEALGEDEVDELVRQKLKASNPDVVIMSIVEDNYNWADRILQVVKAYRQSLPVIVGGPTPTAAPARLIENPNIDYLVQGEGEEAVVELCDLLQRGRSATDLRNVWSKTSDGNVRRAPLLRPFINMDTIPFQDVELWDRRHFFKPYDGKLYWTGYFEMSRGCPYLCTYCVNHTIQSSLKTAGKYFRRKSPSQAVKEIKLHKEKYDLKRIVFCDDNFLLMPGPAFQEWGAEFKAAWKEVNLPYWITTSADFIHPETLQVLAETGCDGIGLGVEAGGEWFKRNILKRRLTNERTVEIFRMVHDYGIRSTANIMMGFPGEYEEDIFESIKLIQRIQPKSFDVSLVAPYVGTDIHTVCVDLGLIDTFDKPGFRGMSTEISFRQYSTIRNPNISRERISELYDSFADYVSGKLPIPEQFLAPAPGADNNAPARGDMSRDVVEAMKRIKPNHLHEPAVTP